MTSARTDIHAPNADFDPEAYEFVGVYYLGMSAEAAVEHRRFNRDVEAVEARGYRHGGSGRGGCDHCGAHCVYVAIMLHPASQEWITIGQTCLGNRFDASKAQWSALHARVGQARKDAKVLAAYQEFCAAHPVVTYADYALNIGSAGLGDHRADLPATYDAEGAPITFGTLTGKGWALTKIAELHASARRYGVLSEKQLAFLTKLMAELDEAAARLPELRAAREAEAAAKAAIPALAEGRQVITGTVVGGKWVDSDYGPYSGAWKITVLLEGGQRLYGTCPKALRGEKGDVITFTAAVQVSKDDPTFGFYKRPTQANGPAHEG